MKRMLVFAALLFSAVGIPIAIEISHVRTEAREAAKKSAVLALVTEIECEATIYYDEHGIYPSTLAELRITVFPDGGDATLLEEIRYGSDGETIQLSWGNSRWS